MDEKTLKALHWIVEILGKHNIPYQIGGGFAASIYGSLREINDIDISLSGKYFSIIIPEVVDYITIGPKHYSNEKWDCNTISLNYCGQDIDITDVDTLLMSNKEKIEWLRPKDVYRLFKPTIVKIDGEDIALFHPRDLIAYKKELDGEHQLIDMEAIQKYIDKHKL